MGLGSGMGSGLLPRPGKRVSGVLVSLLRLEGFGLRVRGLRSGR